MNDSQRLAAANRIKSASDLNLPALQGWNDTPCEQHSQLTSGCLFCGVELRKHQRKAVGWLYLVERGLLGDKMGLGKTTSLAGLIALLRDKGELENGKVIIVCRALLQWKGELARVLPTLRTMVAIGTRKQRVSKYLESWQVLLITPQMLLHDRELLERFPLTLVISDDTDSIRHAENRTTYAVNRLARFTPRFIVASGTPLQKRLLELYYVMQPIGGYSLFGSEQAYRRRYIIEDSNHRVIAHQNLDELKRKIEPFVLRRTEDDVDDIEMPEVVPENHFLTLYRAQRTRYEDLRSGVVRLVRNERETIKRATALAKLHYGACICGGLATLGDPDGPGMSVKLDWLVDALDGGDLVDQKVVVFINIKSNIRAFQDRLRRMNIGFETIWGDEKDKKIRHASQQRFWYDDKCRILMGTTALEQSLNLQVARHLVNVDTVLNAGRMSQLAGRIKRDGSTFNTVYVHNLLTVDTQEERYLPLLEREAALAGYMWEESSELFSALSPTALLSLITG